MILTEQRKLRPAVKELLSALVNEHLEQHHNNPAASLAALSTIKSVRLQLEALGDPELTASLIQVSAARPELAKGRAVRDQAPAASGQLIILEVASQGVRCDICWKFLGCESR